MKTISCIGLVLSMSIFAVAQTSDIDPCSLVAKEELTKIFGQIKEGPKTKEGLQKEKICEWTNMSGSWIEVSAYSSDRWGMRKAMANDPVDLMDSARKHLRPSAAATRRFAYAKASSCWRSALVPAATSQQIAELAVKKLP